MIHSRLVLLCCLRTIRSCEQQGKPPWIIGPARQDVLGKPLSTSILERSQGGKGFFVLSVISSGKRTALPVRAPACTHTVTSAPACVSLRMCVSKCGAHTCLSAQRKWLTEKNVANSNFNCQWGKKGRGGRGWGGLNIYGLCPDEQRRGGLGMKAYSLSQLKSALTWLQPFEVRLAAILERLVLASNNGTERREVIFKKPKVVFSPAVASPLN